MYAPKSCTPSLSSLFWAHCALNCQIQSLIDYEMTSRNGHCVSVPAPRLHGGQGGLPLIDSVHLNLPPEKIWCCGWSCWYCLQNALKIASSLAGCGWCSPWSMCMQLLPTKKSNQVWIGRMGMCFQSPSCVLSSFSDNANFLTKTLWTSLSGFALLQRAMFSSPPDLCAICSPTSATKSLAAEMHEVHEALASNENNLERAHFQSSIASLQVCSAHCSLIILDMEPV